MIVKSAAPLNHPSASPPHTTVPRQRMQWVMGVWQPPKHLVPPGLLIHGQLIRVRRALFLLNHPPHLCEFVPQPVSQQHPAAAEEWDGGCGYQVLAPLRQRMESTYAASSCSPAQHQVPVGACIQPAYSRLMLACFSMSQDGGWSGSTRVCHSGELARH